jgi:hypothetical protein
VAGAHPGDQLPSLTRAEADSYLPSGCSCGPTATAVCEPLSGSTPIITAIIRALHIDIEGTGRSAAGMPYYSAGARAPFEPHHGETRQAGTSLSSQATVRGRQADTEPAHRAPQRYGPAHCHPGQIRNAYREVPVRRLARRLTGCAATLSDHPPTALDVTGWVWAAGGGGGLDGPHHQCPLAGTDVPAYQPCADVASRRLPGDRWRRLRAAPAR